MADRRLKSWLGQRFDDYVEDTAVGRRGWVIVLLFAFGLPLLTALLEVVFPPLYRPGNVAIALFIGAIVGFALVLIARERSRYRAAAIDHTGDVAALRKKPWGEFEILVGEVFRRQGYVVKERGGFERDFGVDLIAERGTEKVMVQCKHWLVMRVHQGPVKELYADVKSQGFAAGWLVTCGRFTDSARAWAQGKEIRLIDGDALVELISHERITDRKPVEAGAHNSATLAVPGCPNCGTGMLRLVNHYDQSTFWGCPNPACNWTIDDPVEVGSTPTCSHGHLMTPRKTPRGTTYWRCAEPTCSRKRLFVHT